MLGSSYFPGRLDSILHSCPFQLFILTGLTCDRTLLYNDCHYMADLGIAGVGRVGGILVLVGTLLTCWLLS